MAARSRQPHEGDLRRVLPDRLSRRRADRNGAVLRRTCEMGVCPSNVGHVAVWFASWRSAPKYVAIATRFPRRYRTLGRDLRKYAGFTPRGILRGTALLVRNPFTAWDHLAAVSYGNMLTLLH
jgi:hypothetical protein